VIARALQRRPSVCGGEEPKMGGYESAVTSDNGTVIGKQEIGTVPRREWRASNRRGTLSFEGRKKKKMVLSSIGRRLILAHHQRGVKRCSLLNALLLKRKSQLLSRQGEKRKGRNKDKKINLISKERRSTS